METLEPLSTEGRELLERAEVPEPPAGAEGRVHARLAAAFAPPAAAPAQGSATGKASAFGRFGLPFSAGALVVGMLLGALLRGSPPPAPPPAPPAPPPLPEVVVMAPEAPAPEPVAAPEPPRPVVRRVHAEPPPDPDALLAEERNLLETARSALVRGEPKLAVVALEKHHTRFAHGRLAEERESLWIQALIRTGDFVQARAHAKSFRQQFPHSLLLPAIDAALASIPP